MAKYAYGILLSKNTESSDSSKLGAKGTKFTDKDRNKALKYSTTVGGTMELCADGDEIEGFVHSLERFTQDGQTFGQVWLKGPLVRQVVTAAAALNLGDYVVSDAQEAVGTNTGPARHTLNAIGVTKVKKKGSGTSNWKVIEVIDSANRIYLIQAVV